MTSTTDRAARVQAIRDGARVRRALGQAALHELLPDGQHKVVVRGQVYVGATVEEAIQKART